MPPETSSVRQSSKPQRLGYIIPLRPRATSLILSLFCLCLLAAAMSDALVKQTEVDVLVIGSGPAGLMCANALAMAGVNVRIVDQR